MSEIEETRARSKKVLISTTCPSLPFELIIQILILLPVKSLLRFKCVCKEWLSVIRQWSFIVEHWYKASPIKYFGNSGTLLQQYCCALLLEKYCDTNKLRISNPSTYQVLDLPDPCWQESGIAIFMLESSGTFKIVSGKDGGWAVLMLGTDDLSWRILKAPGPPERFRIISNYNFYADEVVYYVKRSIHDKLRVEIEVESLDLETETLTKMSLPMGFFSNLSMLQTILWDDCLAFVSMGGKEIHVLVLEDYKNGRWSTEKIIVPLKFMEDNTDMEYWFITNIEGDWIDIKRYGREYFYYNMVSGKLQIRDAAPMGIGKSLFLIKPSLVSLRGMQTRMEPIVTDP